MAEKRATEIRRDEIIEASLKLIEHHGLDNLSIADIAAEIQLVPSAIYRHFKNKDMIILQLIAFVGGTLQGNVKSVRGENGDTMDKLKHLYKLHTNFLKTQPAIPKIIYSLLASNKKPVLKESIFKVISDYTEQINQLVIEGQSNGDIAPTVDPVAASILFIGMIQPLVILSQQAEGNEVDSFKWEMWEIYIRGMKA